MVSNYSPQSFLNQVRSLQLLSFFFIMMLHFCPGITADINVRGEVGGNVTIHCPVKEQGEIILFYFQRGNTYINGYHTSIDISNTPTWNNTEVDPQNATVHVYNLKASHKGEYKCLIEYKGIVEIDKTIIRLDVTGKYSTPEVTLSCVDGLSCVGKCVSHGGYPGATMMWKVPLSQTWTVLNNSESHDPETMLVNVTSFARFNCSQGELRFLSCFVGDVTSDPFDVCTPNDSPKSHNDNVTIAATTTVVVISVVLLFLLLWWKCKRRQRGTDEQTARANGTQMEEMMALNCNHTP
ncbi:T-lymphocyte activation antigen CD86 [Antennarius striatus]|uniref:T-lymphocyte activation antigen CD86 n=1 Tax=Antennarius striatus TaxID=241820 RepID=UPI0035B475AC